MVLPHRIQQPNDPKTETKFIEGGRLLISIFYNHSPEKKRTNKIPGVLPGKLTEYMILALWTMGEKLTTFLKWI